jgi:hypothetical protein
VQVPLKALPRRIEALCVGVEFEHHYCLGDCLPLGAARRRFEAPIILS